MARLNELCIGSEEARPFATAVKSLVSHQQPHLPHPEDPARQRARDGQERRSGDKSRE